MQLVALKVTVVFQKLQSVDRNFTTYCHVTAIYIRRIVDLGGAHYKMWLWFWTDSSLIEQLKEEQ